MLRSASNPEEIAGTSPEDFRIISDPKVKGEDNAKDDDDDDNDDDNEMKSALKKAPDKHSREFSGNVGSGGPPHRNHSFSGFNSHVLHPHHRYFHHHSSQGALTSGRIVEGSDTDGRSGNDSFQQQQRRQHHSLSRLRRRLSQTFRMSFSGSLADFSRTFTIEENDEREGDETTNHTSSPEDGYQPNDSAPRSAGSSSNGSSDAAGATKSSGTYSHPRKNGEHPCKLPPPCPAR